MHQCPFCKGPIKGVPVDINLSRKQKKVFMMIMSGGPEGVEIDHIMDTLYKGKSKISLRTAVHYINKIIQPLHIESHANTYRFAVDEVSSKPARSKLNVIGPKVERTKTGYIRAR